MLISQHSQRQRVSEDTIDSTADLKPSRDQIGLSRLRSHQSDLLLDSQLSSRVGSTPHLTSVLCPVCVPRSVKYKYLSFPQTCSRFPPPLTLTVCVTISLLLQRAEADLAAYALGLQPSRHSYEYCTAPSSLPG